MSTALRREGSEPAADGIDRAVLVALRKAHIGSASDMARRLGVSRQLYYHYERGLVRIPVPVAARIADVLGIRIDTLLSVHGRRA